MERTLIPTDCTARMADSRPGPGPFTIRSTSWIPMAMAAFNSLFGSQAGSEGRALARTLEAGRARAAPANGVALGVGHGDNRVIKGRVDMHLPGGQSPFDFARGRSATSRLAYVLSHSSFLLTLSKTIWALNNPVVPVPALQPRGGGDPSTAGNRRTHRLFLCSPAAATATGNGLLRTLARA